VNSQEIKQAQVTGELKRRAKIADVVDFGLTAVLAHSGRHIEKVLLKFDGWEFRMVLVVSCEDEGERQVGFHSAETIAGCFMGMYRRVKTGDIRWKADKPWEGTLKKDEAA